MRNKILTATLLVLGIVAIFVLFGKPASGDQVWYAQGENTYIGKFQDHAGRWFTCLMVVGGGGMAGEVKTLACPGVIYVPISKERLSEDETTGREILPESRRLPLLPRQPNAFGHPPEDFGGPADERLDLKQLKRRER